MGVDMYAESDTNQEELDAELKALGLENNLRNCNIPIWKGLFEYCTGISVCDIEWSTLPTEQVASMNAMCNHVVSSTTTEFVLQNQWATATYQDLKRMQLYFNTIAKYGAHLFVC